MNPFRQKRPVAAKPHDHLEEGRGAEQSAARRPPPAEYLDRSLRPLPSGRRHESDDAAVRGRKGDRFIFRRLPGDRRDFTGHEGGEGRADRYPLLPRRMFLRPVPLPLRRRDRSGRIRVARELIRFVATDVFDYHRPSRCRLRVYLRSHGVPEARPGPFEETLRRLGKEHEARHLAALAASTGVADLSAIPDRRERERQTLRLLSEDTPAISQ